jgi:hypothetical protein
MTALKTYHRPTTRGELKRKLEDGVECEVVATNEGITTIALCGWLEFSAFETRRSENAGWCVYYPVKK